MQHQTKLTSQSQVSVPAPIRHALGLKPGSLLEWTLQGDQIVVTRAARCTTADVHQALFGEASPQAAKPKTLQELKQGIKDHMRRQHARA